MTTTVTARLEWDMGHALASHSGKCRQLHGHRYAAEITVAGPVQQAYGNTDDGMVVDFGVVKARARDWIVQHDHRFLIHKEDPRASVLMRMQGGAVVVGYVPTAENIAADLFAWLRADGINVTRVRLYETPTAYAEVTG